VTLPSGRQRMVFSDRVRAREIAPGEGARRIGFDLHGSFCGTDRKLFADLIHGNEILQGRPLKVRFDVHHSICEDGDPTTGCQKVVRIGYRAFNPKRS
jgi:hypothetical protein